MGELPDLKKRTVAEAIVRKWGESISVMEVMRAYRDNALFGDTWRIDMITVVLLHKLT